ncbi:MAG: hypothetical protein V3T81_08975 [Thermoanaerobaculia bacterium]
MYTALRGREFACCGPGRGGGSPPVPEERTSLAERLGVDPGLCTSCVHLRLVASGRSLFVRCALAETDRRFPRYPALPVPVCDGYLKVGEEP